MEGPIIQFVASSSSHIDLEQRPRYTTAQTFPDLRQTQIGRRDMVFRWTLFCFSRGQREPTTSRLSVDAHYRPKELCLSTAVCVTRLCTWRGCGLDSVTNTIAKQYNTFVHRLASIATSHNAITFTPCASLSQRLNNHLLVSSILEDD